MIEYKSGNNYSSRFCAKNVKTEREIKDTDIFDQDLRHGRRVGVSVKYKISPS